MPGPDPTLARHDAVGWLARLADGRVTSVELVAAARARLAACDAGPTPLRAVVELAEDAEQVAGRRDEQRRAGTPTGPLHGLPVLVKDNVDLATGPVTTAGSLALLGTRPVRDATVVARLRDAGAVVLGTANLSEWANFRSTRSTSGWSARGGLTRNPHDPSRSAGGSSSGSAAAVAAGIAPVAVGTETDGSILCPAAACGVVGFKPTVGRISRAGIVPIAASQDSAGPLVRSVRDAALLLRVLAAADPRDPATGRAPGWPVGTPAPAAGLDGVRVGVARRGWFGVHPDTDVLAERAIGALSAAGATIVDPADVATVEELAAGQDELAVLLHEFRAGVEAYLSTRVGDGPRTLADVIAFNRAHADVELAHFGQELFERAADVGGLDDPAYAAARDACRRLARTDGLDPLFARLDVLVAPTMPPAWTIDEVLGDRDVVGSWQPAAVAGYPALSVPVGAVRGLPVGLGLYGAPWSEPTLLRVGASLESSLAAVRR